MASPERLAIIGTGLIGASAGLAAKRAGVSSVTGWDPDPDSLGVAAERGAVEATGSIAEAVAAADLVLVATPVGELPSVVREALDRAPEGATVTDVGSTKRPVSAAAGGDRRFVGGHPICGAETRGPERATADLFDGATWFLTPTAATEPDRLRLVHGFVSALGARPVAIGPDAHDRLVAVTSHLPHVLANVLLNQAGAARVDGHDPLQAAGGSLRDMTRIGGANPRIWVDIFLDNREALRAALAEQRRLLEQVEAGARGWRRGLPRALDRRGERPSAPPPRDGLRRPGHPAPGPDAHPGPTGGAGGDLPGARRRAHQRRGLRARPRLGRARRDADDARVGRERGRPGRASCSRPRATASSSRR